MQMKLEFYHQGLEGFGGREERKSDLGGRHFCGFFVCVCFIFCLFVLMWTIFKVFVELATILLLLFFFKWFASLAVRHVEILAPGPGIELVLPAMEGEALTTGLPGKSQVEDVFEVLMWVGNSGEETSQQNSLVCWV